MTRKEIVLISITAVFAVIYVYYFTDWINRPVIQILPQIRPLMYRPVGQNPTRVFPVSFGMDGAYKLTSVKVIPVDALQTNRHAAPIWHLITKSNSIATKGFIYGLPIPGMQAAVTNARPLRLQAGMSYRIFVEAGRARGQADFSTKAIPGS